MPASVAERSKTEPSDANSASYTFGNNVLVRRVTEDTDGSASKTLPDERSAKYSWVEDAAKPAPATGVAVTFQRRGAGLPDADCMSAEGTDPAEFVYVLPAGDPNDAAVPKPRALSFACVAATCERTNTYQPRSPPSTITMTAAIAYLNKWCEAGIRRY